MNIAEIFAANGLGLVLMILLQISRHMTRRNRRMEDHLLSVLVAATAAACVVESVSFAVDGMAGQVWRWINHLSNTALYALVIIISTAWMMYVDVHLYRDRMRLRRYQPMLIIGTLLVLALPFNLVFHFFFRVDEFNAYHRQPLGYLFYFYLAAAFVISIITERHHRKVFRKAQFFPLPLFLIPVVGASIVQILFYGVSLAWAGVAVGIVGLYINLQSRQSFVDGLTGLYNRQFLEHQMFIAKDRQSGYYGIMLDIDRFKSINDRLGHSVGDAALSNAADILLRAVGMDGQIFRFAGDEFIIILKTDREEDALAVEQSIQEECRRFNAQEDRPYQLWLSMGHGRFDPASDTEDSFLRKIDGEMYVDKDRRRQQAKARG